MRYAGNGGQVCGHQPNSSPTMRLISVTSGIELYCGSIGQEFIHMVSVTPSAVRPGSFALTSAKPAPLNRLRQLWREGRPTFGAIATIPSIQTVQIMARSGIDWIIVDLEHGPIDLGSAHAMITATAGTPCVPMVRIAANEPWLAKAPMDLGALGINFPMICSGVDAEKAVRSVRYPPKATGCGARSTRRSAEACRWRITWRPPTTTWSG